MGLRHQRHEGGRRGPAEPGREPTAPNRDLTFVFYDAEEIAAEFNGLKRLVERHPDWLAGDFAVLMEPTDGRVDGGCQGTLRVRVETTGRRAHSARSWLGENAIHKAAPILARLAAYEPRRVEIDGLTYPEGLNAVMIEGGHAGNVIPDTCAVTVNYRFSPDQSEAEALDRVREVFDGFEVVLTDSAPGRTPRALPPGRRGLRRGDRHGPRGEGGLDGRGPLLRAGIPAVNYGPGDPTLAHTREEHVEVAADPRGGTQADRLADSLSTASPSGQATELGCARVLPPGMV